MDFNYVSTSCAIGHYIAYCITHTNGSVHKSMELQMLGELIGWDKEHREAN